MSKHIVGLVKSHNVPSNEVLSGKGSTGNRHPLLLASSPLLFMAAACVFAVGQRHVANRLSDKTFGQLSRTQAKQVADEACTRLTGERAEPTHATYQSAYSVQRGAIVREWDIVCSTPGAQYLIRINADTSRVYAVNRLKGTASFPPESVLDTGDGNTLPAAFPDEESAAADDTDLPPRVSRHEAEQQAKRYLGMMGVPSQGLRPVSAGSSVKNGAQWNFTFRRKVPGMGSRLLKVSIDGQSGALEHLWNPVFAL